MKNSKKDSASDLPLLAAISRENSAGRLSFDYVMNSRGEVLTELDQKTNITKCDKVLALLEDNDSLDLIVVNEIEGKTRWVRFRIKLLKESTLTIPEFIITEKEIVEDEEKVKLYNELYPNYFNEVVFIREEPPLPRLEELVQ